MIVTVAIALVADPVAVILTFNPAAAVAAKAATATILVVFATGANPLELGLVPSASGVEGTVEFADTDQIQYSARSMQLESRSNELSDSFVCLSPMCEHC